MRIGLAWRAFHERSGLPRYCVELARRLARTDELHLFARTVEASIPGTKSVTRFPFDFRSKRVEYGPNTVVNSAVLRTAKALRRLDIVNTQGAELLGFDVITAHGTWWGHFRAHAAEDSVLRAELGKSMFPVVERANYRLRRYKRVIAVSELTRRELRGTYEVPDEDIVTIPEGVDVARFRPDETRRRAWRSRMGFDGDFVLLHVTTDFVRKGLRTIIRAMPSLSRNARLIVVGREDPAPYQEEARRLGVADQITYVPYAEAIEDFYAGADVFVFPSHYEAFGLSVLEAMAAGLPTVCTRSLGVAELLTDGNDAILVNRWDNPTELAEAVNRLGPDARRTIGRAARSTAERHPWELTTRETRIVYESCLRR